MKRDEVREIFPNATDEEVDALLNRVGGELNPLKERLRKAEGERDEANTALDAARRAETDALAKLDEANARIEEGMSAEELLAAREKAAEEREREFNLKANGLDAKEIFVSAGCFSEEELAELVEQVTGEDAEQTRARAQRIVDTVARQREEVAKATRDELLKANPRMSGGSGGEPGVPATRKEFLALDLKTQLELKQADPDILTRLK